MEGTVDTTAQQIVIIRAISEEAERRGILLWLESGWAIDARLGRITREHGDIDIAFAKNHVVAYRELIEELGFDQHEFLDYGFLSRRGALLLDSEACLESHGEYGFADFPTGSCPQEKQGVIQDDPIRCVSWAAMYFEFLGYLHDIPQEQWREKDFESLRLIEAHLTETEKRSLKDLYTDGVAP